MSNQLSAENALAITAATDEMVNNLPPDIPRHDGGVHPVAKAATGFGLAAIGLAAGGGVASAETVTIEPGDTLGEIVEERNEKASDKVTVAEVARQNGIADPDEIRAGDEVNFDEFESREDDGFDPNNQKTWVPKWGDTVDGTLGVSDKAFEAANPGVDADVIEAGKSYNVPGADNTVAHVAQKGDTLSDIAARYGTTVGQLRSANPQITNPNLIFVGQKINVGESSAPETYLGATVTRDGSPVDPDHVQPGDVVVTKDHEKLVVKAGDTVDEMLQADNSVQPEHVDSAQTQPTPEVIAPDDELMKALESKWKNSTPKNLSYKLVAIKTLLDEGVPPPVAAGIMGNIFGESSYDPGIEETTSRSEKGFGFAQWTFERREALEARAAELGVSPSDPTFQIKFLVDESKKRPQRENDNANEWEGLIAISDPAEAARYFHWNFERPAERIGEVDKRAKEAVAVYNDILAAKQEVVAKQAASTPAEVGAPIDPNQPQLLNGEVFVPRDPDKVPDGHGQPGTNGNIESELVPFGEAWPGHRGQKEMVEAFLSLNHEFHKEFGRSLEFTDSYRSYPSQIDTKRRKGRLAATPGTSNHGGGVAIDFGSNINNADSPEYKWMMENAPRFGFVNPHWARDNKGIEEPWHWEYMNEKEDNQVAESLQEQYKEEVAAGMAYAKEITESNRAKENEMKQKAEQQVPEAKPAEPVAVTEAPTPVDPGHEESTQPDSIAEPSQPSVVDGEESTTEPPKQLTHPDAEEDKLVEAEELSKQEPRPPVTVN